MATIKSYTNINQSKKLAEFLPLESADMFYNKEPEDESYPKDIVDTKYPIVLREGDIRFLEEYGIPCWSLSALLGVLPDDCGISREDGIYAASYIVSNKGGTYLSDNPIDACVAMIEKLNELNLL